jgi:hypothetical protein
MLAGLISRLKFRPSGRSSHAQLLAGGFFDRYLIACHHESSSYFGPVFLPFNGLTATAATANTAPATPISMNNSGAIMGANMRLPWPVFQDFCNPLYDR